MAMEAAVYSLGRKTANPRQGTKTTARLAFLGKPLSVGRKTANPRQGTKTAGQVYCIVPSTLVGRQPILARGLRLIAEVGEDAQALLWRRRKTANPRQGTKTVVVAKQCGLHVNCRKTANPRQGTKTHAAGQLP